MMMEMGAYTSQLGCTLMKGRVGDSKVWSCGRAEGGVF